jgi:geranylgeranyl diphosphate synthase type II
MSPVPAFFADYQTRVDEALRHLIRPERGPVERSMGYTLFAPSKRVRPVLTLLSAELCGGQAVRALAAAAAIEFVHTSSLILDDLPSMDNAELRRGRRANHLEFGEAIAILAAFALLNLAYGTLARSYDATLSTRLATLLDDAVGHDGLIAGQAADLLAVGSDLDFPTAPQTSEENRNLTPDRTISFELLERIHRGKTGALFNASAVAGALTAGADADSVSALSAFAKNLGLAFQIIDDLLDVEGDPSLTGKAIRKDARKTTFVSFSGVAGAHQLAAELCQTADRALAPFGRRADRLRELSAFVAARSI